mgnify:CR=1 FL=1
MNKKLRKTKKDIKRNLRDIGFKKSCKMIKKAFYTNEKTAIFTNCFHPEWNNYPQPAIEELENGYILDNTERYLSLNISKATNTIVGYKLSRYKVLVSCHNFKDNELNWFVI